MGQILEKVILPSVITTSDMAYVEEAEGTRGMLKLIEWLIRYELDNHKMVTVDYEKKALISILSLYRYKFGSFEFDIYSEPELEKIDVPKGTLVTQLMFIIEDVLMRYKEYSILQLLIENDVDTGHLRIVEKR